MSVGETLAAFRECGGLPQTEERLGQALSCRAAQALPRSFHLPHTFGILSETARHDNRVADRSPTRRRRAAFVAAAAAKRSAGAGRGVTGDDGRGGARNSAVTARNNTGAVRASLDNRLAPVGREASQHD